MDIAGSMTPDECMDELGLDKIRDKAWHITYDVLHHLACVMMICE